MNPQDDWKVQVRHTEPPQRVKPRNLDCVEFCITRYSAGGLVVWDERIMLSVCRKNLKNTWSGSLVLKDTSLPDYSTRLDMNMIHGWLRGCLTSHEECNLSDRQEAGSMANDALVPTRLIEVESEDLTPSEVRLYETRSTRPSEYLALLYRWGGPQHVVLNMSSRQEFLHGLSLLSLPIGI